MAHALFDGQDSRLECAGAKGMVSGALSVTRWGASLGSGQLEEQGEEKQGQSQGQPEFKVKRGHGILSEGDNADVNAIRLAARELPTADVGMTHITPKSDWPSAKRRPSDRPALRPMGMTHGRKATRARVISVKLHGRPASSTPPHQCWAS